MKALTVDFSVSFYKVTKNFNLADLLTTAVICIRGTMKQYLQGAIHQVIF